MEKRHKSNKPKESHEQCTQNPFECNEHSTTASPIYNCAIIYDDLNKL